MRVTLNWLRELVEIDLPVGELAERLSKAGLEVSRSRSWAASSTV